MRKNLGDYCSTSPGRLDRETVGLTIKHMVLVSPLSLTRNASAFCAHYDIRSPRAY